MIFHPFLIFLVYEATLSRFHGKWKVGMETLYSIIPVYIWEQIFLFFGIFFSGGDKNRKFQVSDVLLHSCSIITASLKIIPQYNVDVVRCLKHSGQLSLQSVTGRERVLAHSLYCIRLLSFCKVLGYHSQMQDHKGKRDCQWSYCGGWRLRTLPS